MPSLLFAHPRLTFWTSIVLSRYTETDYLETYSENPKDMFDNKSVDKAMMNTFTQTRKWVMAEYGLTEAEATTVITNGVDFMMTQLVDGNLGMHSVIPKGIFTEVTEAELTAEARSGRRSRKLQGDAELKLSPETVHWGYFSKTLEPVLTVASGDEVVVEMATHHACDDWDRMIKGDEGMESIYTWTADGKGEDFRGATGGGDGKFLPLSWLYFRT
jgi:acetamidase/formamidase